MSYLVEAEDGFILIDTGVNTAEAFAALKRKLDDIGLDFGDISQIVITHFHSDHCGQVAHIHELGGRRSSWVDVERTTLGGRAGRSRRPSARSCSASMACRPSRPKSMPRSCHISRASACLSRSISLSGRDTPYWQSIVGSRPLSHRGIPLGMFVSSCRRRSSCSLATISCKRSHRTSDCIAIRAPIHWETICISLRATLTLGAARLLPSHGLLVEDPENAYPCSYCSTMTERLQSCLEALGSAPRRPMRYRCSSLALPWITSDAGWPWVKPCLTWNIWCARGGCRKSRRKTAYIIHLYKVSGRGGVALRNVLKCASAALLLAPRCPNQDATSPWMLAKARCLHMTTLRNLSVILLMFLDKLIFWDS